MSSNIQVQENIEKDTSIDYPSPTSPSVSKTQSKESSIEKVPQQHNFTKVGIFKPAYFSRAIFKQLENLQISKTQFFEDLKNQLELENQCQLENPCKDNNDLFYNSQFEYFTDFIHVFHRKATTNKEDFKTRYFTEFIHNFNQVTDVTKEDFQLQYFTEFIHNFNQVTDVTKEDFQLQYFTEFIHNFNQVTDVIKEDFQIQHFTEFIHNFDQVTDVTKEDFQLQYFTEFIHNFNQVTDVTKEDFQIQYFNDFVHFLDQIADSATATSSSASASASSSSNLNNAPHKTDKVIQFIHNPIKPNQKKLGKLEKIKNFIKYGTTKGKETQDIPNHVEEYVLNKIKIAKNTKNKIDISSIAETLKQEQLTQEELDYCLYKIYSSSCKKSIQTTFKKLFKRNKNKKEPPIKGCLKISYNPNYSSEKKISEEADSQTIEKFMSELIYRENRGLDPIYKRNIKNTQLQQVQNYYGDNVEVYLEQ
ncbi:hypothetical protein KGF54_005501 [Candida jiufengensis]|uniref:uncharacterized protein n=1 Tax=Candida jiufengensis TaxID=497108 RepID=UPI0022249394|nr:uncharacterized protein KGF54_005501 [Candida jiufengensis]KAI5949623.1 hypothetical protein KGF54_005501 [Candida jiufengensis]